ncbi:replicative DNA helicase [Geodermatophilus poikilotrophus]|uniref:Replicative DNA helicase n=1 Tax=Geodermatophilus poikilotrophus TaxID=1333667 RepID=A0A1I0GLF1_9ACTN|nr:replicative DNA helicase [Geodermatophilus poikilotrophus]SET71196.1 primary replicative DNA helicase /intein [Geodermatophilus poikilotrophus]
MAVADDFSRPTPTAPQYDRQPPQDVAAEQSVLGGMLLSKDAIADVVEVLAGPDFYRPAHQVIFDCILDLYGRGEPADAITVAAELNRTDQLSKMGGAVYLHTLIQSTPTAANAGYYAAIVAEQAVLRRLVEAGTRVVQLGYGAAGGKGDVDDIVDRAQQEIYDVTEKRMSEDYSRLEDVLQPTMDELDAIASRGGTARGVPTGIRDLDELTNGLQAGQMVVIAARPGVGKSTLGLDIARSATVKHHLATCIFSLEMSKHEITMRLLSAEAKVPLHHMRAGTLSDEDWSKLARRMGEIADAPLYIDDSPNMTMMEIRAKARRLKQRNDLKLVVIDYLQLMTSGKRVESRQQEVSEFSRALKLLAKELEVPVIAMSQLNRGSEQRQDKKPMLSDLRESGCLPAETRILRADTGAETTMGEIFESGATDVPVWALDDNLRYVRRHLTHVFSTGRKPVLQLTTSSGKTIRATANHPFLTYDGFRPLGELAPGDRIAVPRHVPAPDRMTVWADEKVVLLAHLIGDGSFVKRQPLRYASIDEENLRAVTTAALHFGVVAVRDEYAAARCTSLRLRAPFPLTHGRWNPVAAWLDELGLFGLRSHEKFVPQAVYSLPKKQIALFLRHLWATDGSVTVNKNGRGGRVYYASTSRQLVDDLSRLLLRFGISCRIRRVRKPGYRDGWTLDISGCDDQRRFLGEIGVHGARGAAAEQLLGIVRELSGNPNVDTVPVQVWERVRAVLEEKGMSHRAFAAAMGSAFNGSGMWKHAPSRERLGRIAAVLDDAELEIQAVNDVLWDEVVSIEQGTEEEVYDATVLGGHNFVAEGIAVHNSIEQDADMVMMIHREDMYEKESPRAGEADIMLVKHRNGPTANVTVAFQGHYSRFVDMAN